MPVPRRLPLALALVVTTVLLGAAHQPSAGAASSAAAPPHGGTIRTAFSSDFATLDPAVGYDPFSWTGEHAIFDGLLDYASAPGSAGTRLVPRLAAALPSVSKDGLVYRFTLRHGVHFQPPVNREVTAEDVRYSIERALSPHTTGAAMVQSPFWSSLQGINAFWNKKAAHISGITVSGRYGITFRLSTPNRAFLNILTMPFTSVVPREIVRKYGAKFSDHAVGTGPFMLKSWAHGSRMILVRNPHYFRAGYPRVDKVVIDFNVKDSLQVQRVEAGALDVGGDLVGKDDFLSLKNNPTYSSDMTKAPDVAVNYIAFNLKQKPFKGNLYLRQAINMALNKRFILKTLNGRGVVMNGILPPTMPGANPNFSYYSYNPSKASALLRKAGYRPGQLTIPLVYKQSSDFDAVATQIAAQLGAIGITVKPKPLLSDAFYNTVYTQKEGPMVLAPWGQDYPDPSDFFDPILSCGASSNAAFYCNPKVDALGNKARANGNTAERYAQYRQMEEMVMADAPWAPIYDGILYDFHGPHLGGFYIHPVWPFNYDEYYVKK